MPEVQGRSLRISLEIREAPEAERRLHAEAAAAFDEFLLFPFRATNEPPFPFEWVDQKAVVLDYSAALTRISSRYQERF